MPVVEPLEEEQIEDELREYVQFFKGPLGVVPNSVRTMSWRPHIARAFTDLNIAVMRCDGSVTPEFKRLIGYLNRWNDSMGSALEDLPIGAEEKYLKQYGWEVGKHK